MASSSSCDHNKNYHYDVFLSFSGEDTRKTFVDHLYAALDQQGICTFKDDERLEKGRNISDDLLQSIEESRIYIIVFSKRYASSSWCLNELLKIMECHKTNEQTAFPVFYDVDPSEVRKQNGSVGESFDMLKNKNESEIEKWREALTEASNLSGWDVRKTADGHEAKVIKLIVERVSLTLPPIDTLVDENLVGMEKRMQDLDSCLKIGSNDVRVIGIKGMGGAGKTTLARAIFDRISINFEGTSFVENVRERASQSGLKKLQKQVLRDVLKDNTICVKGVYEGKNLIKKKLRGKKVLVVLDDVDREEQLEELVGDPNWFKLGSRIIITTRDEQVLNTYTLKWIIDVNLLSDEEAIHLFSRHAFRRNIPTQEYETQSCEVVRYAAGLPLTIKVLGSFLRGKNKREWIDALARLKKIPLKETLKKLELSYDNLEDDYKKIFLDVACFLKHWKEDHAKTMLESCGFHARTGLRVLQQKSLITIDKKWNKIQMHDHIEEMGKNIVRREHQDEPHRHSRLWVQEEVEHVLANGLGTEATRCIDLKITPRILLKSLENMKKLRCLIVNHKGYKRSDDCVMIDEACHYFPNSLQYLYWYDYPYRYLPKTFEANNLVALQMFSSNIIQLWEGGKVMYKLKFLFLRDTKLKSLDLGLTPNLERLHLQSCHDLATLKVHGGCLKSLVYLHLSDCQSLKSCLFINQFESLEVLQIGVLNMKEFPDYIISGHSSSNLLEFRLSGNHVKEIPSSIGNLQNLVSLTINSCYFLKSLPESICRLQHLRTLSLDCTGIEELPADLGGLNCLENLDLVGIKVKHLPNSICMLKHLKTLLLTGCKLLENLPEDIGQLEFLEILDLRFCYNLRYIPNNICRLKHLIELELEYCSRLEKLPNELGDLECLRLLNIKDTGITHLPPSIYLLKSLKICRSQPKDQISKYDFIQLCFNYNDRKCEIQGFSYLRNLNLRKCGIEELPEALGHLELLESLNLSYANVKRLPDSIWTLKHLKKLILRRCVNLENLPDDVAKLESLEELDMSRCYNVRDISTGICMLKQLKMLALESCDGVEVLPKAIRHLELVEVLNFSSTDVKRLPGSICMLKHLKTLILRRCVLLEKLPHDVGQLKSLVGLDLSSCYSIRRIPSSICMLKQLKILDLHHCFCLEKLPEDVGQLESLKELYLTRCYNIKKIPSSICMLKHLKILELEGCRRLEKLPNELAKLECLKELNIWDTAINHLPHSISLISGLKIYGFMSSSSSYSVYPTLLASSSYSVYPTLSASSSYSVYPT